MTDAVLNITLTDAGMAAVAAAHGQGVAAKITHVAVGDVGHIPSAAVTALVSEKARVALTAGGAIAPNQVLLQGLFAPGGDEFFIREMGYFLEDGTLLGIWSDPVTPLGWLGGHAPWFFKLAFAWAALPDNSITVLIADDAGQAGMALDLAQLEGKVRHTVEVGGGTPWSGEDNTQLTVAIQAMIAAGINSINLKQHSIVASGQAFAAGVENGNVVRWDGVESSWAKALADGTVNDLAVGIADITNGEVVLYGETRIGLLSGLIPGSRYYLALDGSLSAVPGADVLKVGVAKAANVMFVDIDALDYRHPFVGGSAPIVGAARSFASTDNAKVIRRFNNGVGMNDTLPGSGGVLAAGWWTDVVNSDPLAVLTITADAGSALDGGAQLILGPGQSVRVHSDGVSYWATRGTGRIQLRADLTIYVSTTGNDATNTGLTAASPFLTMQRAWNLLAAQYDLNGYTATIQLADGTYTAPLSARGKIVGSTGAPSVVIQGNTGNINAVIISTTGSTCLSADGSEFTAKYLKLQTTTSGSAITSRNFGVVSYGWINFGAVAGAHIAVTNAGSVTCVGDYTISGGGWSHWAVSNLGSVMCSGFTITLTGTPAFSYTFASCYDLGSIYAAPLTFAGAASGTRYIVTLNAVIYVNGSGASYFPGSIAGTTTTGGQYG